MTVDSLPTGEIHGVAGAPQAALDVGQATQPKRWWRRAPLLSERELNRVLLAEVDREIAEVSPNYVQVSKAMRQFAGRHLSAERPHESVLGIISPRSGEGRTTIALGLAGALSEIYESVVLVEMETDQAAPTLSTELELDVERGLRDFARDESLLDTLIVPTRRQNLWLLPAGPIGEQASRLDASASTRRLLAELQRQFDVVVLDLPPLLTSEEAPVLLPELSGVVLVASAGSTTTDDIRQVLDLTLPVPLKGVLLNRVRLRAPRWLASLFRS